MSKLTTIKWKEFQINEIFIFRRGTRYKRSDHLKGNYKYIASTSFNNGIDNYVGETFKNKVIENAIGLNNSGSVGKAFYHKDKCIYSDHVTWLKLKNKELNELIACFIIPILEKLKSKYSFGREINNDRLKKEKIILPVDDDNMPNWRFMECYVKERAKNILFEKKIIMKKYDFNLKNIPWKEFRIGEIFNIKGSGKSKTICEVKEGIYNYITTKATLNGINSKSNYYNNNANVITVDSATIGISFYQDKQFVASDHIEILEPKKYKLNRFVGLFLSTILRQNMYLYNYGRKRSQTRIAKEIIYLPIDDSGNPNWKFMECYVKERAKNIYF